MKRMLWPRPLQAIVRLRHVRSRCSTRPEVFFDVLATNKRSTN